MAQDGDGEEEEEAEEVDEEEDGDDDGEDEEDDGGNDRFDTSAKEASICFARASLSYHPPNPYIPPPASASSYAFLFIQTHPSTVRVWALEGS